MLFLGEKGQAKSRLMRLMRRSSTRRFRTSTTRTSRCTKTRTGRSRSAAGNWSPACRPTRCRSPGGRATSATPSGLSPGTKFADIIGEIDPAKLAAGVSMAAEDALHFGLIPRMHRGIFAMNELPELDELVQVGLFNILEERDVQIRGYPVQFDIDVLILFSANPATYNRSRQGDPAAQGPHRLADPHALPAGARSGHSDHGAGSRRSEVRGRG